MPSNHSQASRARHGQDGFSLIELMIAMILGLIVVAAAGGVFISNKRVYNATETLGRIQENGRVAFELMSRDLREAGGNPCGSALQPVNMLDDATDPFWNRFAEGITGYAPGEAMPLTTVGTGTAQRVAGTDAVEVHSALGGGVRVINHDTPSATLDVTSVDGFVDGDILLVCNIAQSFVFQVTGFNANGVVHNGGGGQTLNCSQSFQVFDEAEGESCQSGNSSGNNYCFTDDSEAPPCPNGSIAPAYVVRLGSIQWYIGNNARGGTSLYRAIVTNRSGTAVPATELARDEIVEGVVDMTVEYLEQGNATYSNAAGVADWRQVVATRVTLELEGAEGALTGREVEGTDGDAIGRTVTHVVTLRNREGTL